ncbi:hypothetical protein Sjap_002539 [Stephania japonica]|uniref:Uncharacterized protein n=1 Tax=Stephania japonica TaxID=461633 RepID=A0AAP0KNU1_9MAGN
MEDKERERGEGERLVVVSSSSDELLSQFVRALELSSSPPQPPNHQTTIITNTYNNNNNNNQNNNNNSTTHLFSLLLLFSLPSFLPIPPLPLQFRSKCEKMRNCGDGVVCIPNFWVK